MIQIGPIKIDGQLFLAPMAGINQLPFRQLCRESGAALVSSEMVSCHGIMRGQPNTLRMLATTPEEKPVAFQLFGAEPEVMAAASVRLAEMGADIVDLNFGCPVPKVVRHRGGSALLKEPELLQAIVAECVRQCPRPITVKIRSGWDSVNAPEIAQRAEAAGAALVAVHARTRSQRFEGQADWRVIRAVVQAVKIPVVGNGDVRSGADARRMLDETGCAAIMVGRAALGRPWIFGQIREYLRTGQEPPEPAMPQRAAVIRRHYYGLKVLRGERTARLEMRKHTAWYLHGCPGAAAIRRQVFFCEDEASFLTILDQLEKLEA